jgi:hypothetical protein
MWSDLKNEKKKASGIIFDLAECPPCRSLQALTGLDDSTSAAEVAEVLNVAAAETTETLLQLLQQNYTKKPIFKDYISQRNCVKMHNYTIEFSRSESAEVSSAQLPEQANSFIDDTLLLTEEAVKHDVSDDKPIFDLLYRQKVYYLSPLCNSCFVDLESSLFRKLREMLLLSQVSNGIYEPEVKLSLFLRGDDNSGRSGNIFQIFKFLKSHSHSQTGGPSFIQPSTVLEDLLLKANSIIRSFTEYRKFHFKNGISQSGASRSVNGSSEILGTGKAVPLSTPVSSAVCLFDIGLDRMSNISTAELKCFLIDTRVLLGRVMKNDSNFLGFNIFYDLVNELAMVDEELFRTIGFFSMNRSYNSTQFDILNRPLSYYLQKLKSESEVEAYSTSDWNHSNTDLFTLAGVFTGSRLSDTFCQFYGTGIYE